MPAVTIEQIEERLRDLPAEKLEVVFDFVSFLAERQWERSPENGAADLAEAGLSDYLANLEDYEERLSRGEIQW